MFQDFALFPHKDVAANVAFGLRMQDLSRQEVEGRVSEMLNLVGMQGYRGRRVYDLSGGEQQRVALARSLAPDPRLLMLDEPLGSLDRALREELMNELRTILKRVGVTSIYVTHDQQEAFAVSDRVILMRRGSVVQQGTPRDLYFRPVSSWVARFLGLTNLLPGRIVTAQAGSDGEVETIVSTALGDLVLRGVEGSAPDQEVTVLVRPEAARLADERCAKDEFVIEGILRGSSFRGSQTHLEVWFQGGEELVFALSSGGLRVPDHGERVSLALRPEGITLLAGESR
jgi:ABC-type Fe3+/spermidine/putrescine transport system ATPase subunit